MSKYSGKCDFGDTWEILGDRIKNAKIYFGYNIVPLKIESEKDALPYFPYLVGSMASSDESTTIHLSTISYVDQQEKNILESSWESAMRVYRRLVRNKEAITVDAIIKETFPSFEKDNQNNKVMAEAIVRDGKKAKMPSNIHTPMAEHYRKVLYDDMIKAGYAETEAYKWVYGMERFIRKYIKKEDD